MKTDVTTLISLVLLSPCTMVFAASHTPDLSGKPTEWYRSPDGLRITTNILSWQSDAGSWPKNMDASAKPYAGNPASLHGTFDNGATTTELRFLARACTSTSSNACQLAFYKGLDHIFTAQFTNGGWPQYYPLSKQYHRHITFNDDAMVRLLRFLRDVAHAPEFAFVDAAHRKKAQESFDRGIECILNCQVRENGKLTVWCAQHDEVTLKPAGARSYELPSLSGSESVGILELLMSLDRPSPQVRQSIEAGIAWFASAKQSGFKIEKLDGVRSIVRDPTAPPLWARFYDLENGRPFFCDRDGIKKDDYMQIGKERRNGYAWYGNWGAKLEPSYREWKKKFGA
jgi:PelA/Pel-15E family pectate lyase